MKLLTDQDAIQTLNFPTNDGDRIRILRNLPEGAVQLELGNDWDGFDRSRPRVLMAADEFARVTDALAAHGSAERSQEPARVTIGDGELSVTVAYDNRGEPFRQGASIRISAGSRDSSAFLTRGEIRTLLSALAKS